MNWREHLIVGEHSESVDACIDGKARARCIATRHHAGNKGAVSQAILQRGLMRPICPFPAQQLSSEILCARSKEHQTGWCLAF